MPASSPDAAGDPAQTAARATLAEVFATQAADGAARAFVLSHLDPGRGPVVWAQDRLTRREAGEPCLPGLGTGFRLIRLDLGKPADVLWAMEQALECRELGAVLGEIWGETPVAGFTATKRLALRAEAHGVPCWLIRRAARPDLSAARERWRVASAPSLPHPDDDIAPGLPVWQAELFRARERPPGRWNLIWDRASRQRIPAARGPAGLPGPAAPAMTGTEPPA
jgi:protein ImuA